MQLSRVLSLILIMGVLICCSIVQAQPPEEHQEGEIFPMGDVQPEYPGGDSALYAFIDEHLHIPKEAIADGKRGRVWVRFVIDTAGGVTNIEVLKDTAGYGCAEEAIKVVKRMPKWTPGISWGKKVPVKYTIPFKFYLD